TDVTVRPDSRYGVSKAFGEALGALYAEKHGLRVLCLRIGNVGDRPIDERSWWDNHRAWELGYRPTGRAEDWREEALAAQAKLPSDPIGDYFQGGSFC